MRACVLLLLGGCALANPTVEIDQSSIDMPRGTSRDILVTVDGDPAPAYELLWSSDDPDLVSVTKSYDGHRLHIGGDHEGDTVVHINSYGNDFAIPVHVGPPALVSVWTEPDVIMASVGEQLQVRAKAIDTIARVVDVTDTSNWTVRDESVVQLDMTGMMVYALETGETTINVAVEGTSALVPVSVFK
jgi:hypothetical protein